MLEAIGFCLPLMRQTASYVAFTKHSVQLISELLCIEVDFRARPRRADELSSKMLQTAELENPVPKKRACKSTTKGDNKVKEEKAAAPKVNKFGILTVIKKLVEEVAWQLIAQTTDYMEILSERLPEIVSMTYRLALQSKLDIKEIGINESKHAQGRTCETYAEFRDIMEEQIACFCKAWVLSNKFLVLKEASVSWGQGSADAVAPTAAFGACTAAMSTPLVAADSISAQECAPRFLVLKHDDKLAFSQWIRDNDESEVRCQSAFKHVSVRIATDCTDKKRPLEELGAFIANEVSKALKPSWYIEINERFDAEVSADAFFEGANMGPDDFLTLRARYIMELVKLYGSTSTETTKVLDGLFRSS